ncbi:MAG: phosphoribosyltransferase family protein, partial [Bacteroidota bacterium]
MPYFALSEEHLYQYGTMNQFLDREDAARKLFSLLKPYRSQKNSIVLTLPRGGVPVGRYIADHLHWPLDIVIVKKIGHPLNPEYAVGSASATGYVVNKHELIPENYVATEVARLQREIRQKYQMYQSGRKPIDPKQKTALLVDDGMATGSTMLGAIDLVRGQGAKQIIVAVPVASEEAYRKTARKAD